MVGKAGEHQVLRVGLKSRQPGEGIEHLRYKRSARPTRLAADLVNQFSCGVGSRAEFLS